MLQTLIAQAMKLLIGKVFEFLPEEKVPVPQEFWARVADLSARLATAMVVEGGKPSDESLEPYYQELHGLMRRFNLIETV